MVPWYQDYVMVIKGSESQDTDDDGDEATIALAGILPMRVVFGDVIQTGDMKLRGRNDVRIEFACVPKPYTVKANVDPRFQDYGHCWQAQKALAHTFVHIMALYKNGSDHSAGPIPRARLDLDTGLTDNDFWIEEISFPRTTVLEGDAKPQPNFEEGSVTMSYTLVSCDPEP